MKKLWLALSLLLAAALSGTLSGTLSGVISSAPPPRPAPLVLPYKQAGLTQAQAAACLLDRFAFGARPGDVERVVAGGLENWLLEQLDGRLPDPDTDKRLAPLKTLTMSAAEIARTYPNPGAVLAMAVRDGAISPGDTGRANRRELLKAAIAYAESKGIRSQKEMLSELAAGKFLRALYSRNQLREVLTDFWFNHFNVSATDNQARPYVLAYDRDVIRPNALGRFRDMLPGTAKHPAMLAYLDNTQSSAPDSIPTTMSARLEQYRTLPGQFGRTTRTKIDRMVDSAKARQNRLRDKLGVRPGINENYARELMELHTLGVDGGYTQKDVVEVARALTGWTMLPANPDKSRKTMDRVTKGQKAGFVVQGDFVFNAAAHDAAPKHILGRDFPAGGGLEEGESVLDMLCRHPSTARFIARKLAVRFVSDTPSDTLVTRLAAVFTQSDGDTRAMIRAIAESPEFWMQAARRSKIKSPFEVAASSLRALDADVFSTAATYDWVKRMGQPLFACVPPTGFPDRADAWVNTGALLNRMNFGLNLAMDQIMGIEFDLAKLNRNREPESAGAALATYAALLMPERDLKETVRLLTPIITAPDFAGKVRQAAERTPVANPAAGRPVKKQRTDEDNTDAFGISDQDMMAAQAQSGAKSNPNSISPQSVAQIVGIILGSPEFQRR